MSQEHWSRGHEDGGALHTCATVAGFGDKSPEAKAAASLHNFFTYVALKIVLAQLEVSRPGALETLGR